MSSKKKLIEAPFPENVIDAYFFCMAGDLMQDLFQTGEDTDLIVGEELSLMISCGAKYKREFRKHRGRVRKRTAKRCQAHLIQICSLTS